MIDRIIIHNYVALSEDMKTSYGLLNVSAKHDFCRELFYDFMNIGPNIEINAIPKIGQLEIIDKSITIYFDGFTRDRLIHSIRKVSKALQYSLYCWEDFVNTQHSV